MKEIQKTSGKFRLVCHKIDGSIRWDTGWINNGTTNAGKAQFALLVGASGTPFSFLGLGTSSTAFSPSQTTLQAELTTLGLGRASATVSQVTTTATNDTLQLYKVFASTGTTTIEEIGYFNAVSAGVMGGRALTGSKPVDTGETITATYQVQFV